MSQQASPLTYEGVLEMFEKSDQRFDRRLEESDRRFDERMEKSRREFDQSMEKSRREFDKKIGKLTSRIGDIVENMVGGNIVAQFQHYGYNVTELSRNIEFGIEGTTAAGEIDVLLDDGDVAILIEVKTRPSIDDVRDHIEQLEKYRRLKDGKGEGKKRYIGAIAGAVVDGNVVKFAQKHGMFVIVQSGYAVEILAPPEGFKAKEW